MTDYNHPESIVYIKVHSWCCAFYRLGQMYNDVYPLLYVYLCICVSIFTALKNLHALLGKFLLGPFL